MGGWKDANHRLLESCMSSSQVELGRRERRTEFITTSIRSGAFDLRCSLGNLVKRWARFLNPRPLYGRVGRAGQDLFDHFQRAEFRREPLHWGGIANVRHGPLGI